MGIQRCNQCGRKFNYIDILDSFGWGYKPIVCSECGAKYNLKMIYVFTIAIILSLPIFFIGRVCSLATTIKLKFLVALVYMLYMAVVVGVYPFIIRYSLSEDKI